MSADEDHGSVDYEEVFQILPENFCETWKDNPDVLMYLSELGSLGLQQLSQEPDKLSEQRTTVLEQTQDLAFHNYKTFIQAAECSHEIFQDFNIIEEKLNSLLDKLPIFSNKCGYFAKDSQKISTRWRQASLTLAKHPQLLEFLEMPQLMDNYVKNGYYDEALELTAYVKRLEKKHFDIPLIKGIVHDIQESSHIMLGHLISRLKANIQLPECLKVVGYLRRMDVFNEAELRIKFLQARDSWFQKIINEIDKADAYEHVIKVIECCRIHLFDITTQYKAIFSDDDPMLLVREELKGNNAIFQSWITWKISLFLRILKSDISINLSGRIDSVLAQCMYFGLSFSRVSIDFRPLLVPIFQTVSLQKFCSSLENTTFKCEKLFENHDFSTYTNTTLTSSIMAESLQPPLKFLDFYPLAQYCNDILSALNELKLCFSFAMASDVTSALSKSLKRFIKTIINYHSKQLRNMSDIEIENFNKFCFLLSDLIIHFNKCLSILFPAENISKTLGITTLEFKKFEQKLDVEEIFSPIKSILPSQEDLGLTLIISDLKSDSLSFTNVVSKTPNIENENSLNNQTVLNNNCEETVSIKANDGIQEEMKQYISEEFSNSILDTETDSNAIDQSASDDKDNQIYGVNQLDNSLLFQDSSKDLNSYESSKNIDPLTVLDYNKN